MDLRCDTDECAVSVSKPCSPVSAPSPEILPQDDQPKRGRSESWSSVKEDRNGM